MTNAAKKITSLDEVAARVTAAETNTDRRRTRGRERAVRECLSDIASIGNRLHNLGRLLERHEVSMFGMALLLLKSRIDDAPRDAMARDLVEVEMRAVVDFLDRQGRRAERTANGTCVAIRPGLRGGR